MLMNLTEHQREILQKRSPRTLQRWDRERAEWKAWRSGKQDAVHSLPLHIVLRLKQLRREQAGG